MTLAACTSSAREVSAEMGPLPSIGRPSASTTRPRKPSPTGTERIRPGCLSLTPSAREVAAGMGPLPSVVEYVKAYGYAYKDADEDGVREEQFGARLMPSSM